jgi:hypothetical protein
MPEEWEGERDGNFVRPRHVLFSERGLNGLSGGVTRTWKLGIVESHWRGRNHPAGPRTQRVSRGESRGRVDVYRQERRVFGSPR